MTWNSTIIQSVVLVYHGESPLTFEDKRIESVGGVFSGMR